MGCWENASYLERRDASIVADAVTALFAEEGMRRIARPPRREPTAAKT